MQSESEPRIEEARIDGPITNSRWSTLSPPSTETTLVTRPLRLVPEQKLIIARLREESKKIPTSDSLKS